jgi:hypothetical protein
MKFSVFNPTAERAYADTGESRRLVYRDHHCLPAAGLAPSSDGGPVAADHDDALGLDGDFCPFLHIEFVYQAAVTALPLLRCPITMSGV